MQQQWWHHTHRATGQVMLCCSTALSRFRSLFLALLARLWVDLFDALRGTPPSCHLRYVAPFSEGYMGIDP